MTTATDKAIAALAKEMAEEKLFRMLLHDLQSVSFNDAESAARRLLDKGWGLGWAPAPDAAVVNQERGRIMHLIENIRHDWRMNGQRREVDTCDYIISAIKESWKGYGR